MRTALTIDENVLAAAKGLDDGSERPSAKSSLSSRGSRCSLPSSVTRGDRNGVPLLVVRASAGQLTLVLMNPLGDVIARPRFCSTSTP